MAPLYCTVFMLFCPLSSATLWIDTQPFFNVSFRDRVCSIRALISCLHTGCRIPSDKKRKQCLYLTLSYQTCKPGFGIIFFFSSILIKAKCTSKQSSHLLSSSKVSAGDREVEVRALKSQSGSAWRRIQAQACSRSEEEVRKGPVCEEEMEKERVFKSFVQPDTSTTHSVELNTTAEMTSHLIVLSSEQETKHLLIPVSRCLDLLLFSVFKDRRLKNV